MTATQTRKILTGVDFFDARYGGVFENRCWLLSGPSESGKSAVGLQFLLKGLPEERSLLLSIHRAVDTVQWTCSQYKGLEKFLETGQLTVLEYADFLPDRDSQLPSFLPPEGFLDLQQIVSSNGIQRVVLDTVLPWAMPQNPEEMAESTFSLIRAFERLKCTTLLIAPRPVSPLALRLVNALEAVVPVSVKLSLSLETGERVWNTSKYIGDEPSAAPTPYVIVPSRGACAANGLPVGQPTTPDGNNERARFASAVFGAETREPDRTTRFGVSIKR